MALKLTRETPIGLAAPDAYLRVEGVSLPSKTELSFRLRSYVSIGHPAFEDEGFDCAYDMNGPNPFVQAYTHLKTLEQFSDAEDL